MSKESVRAIGLLSGGLDSILAVKCMLEQGISVIPVHFLMPFMRSNPQTVANSQLQRNCQRFGIELQIISLGQSFLDMVMSPAHGHGRNLNPCIDCKIFFLLEARRLLDSLQADFIFTGEVLGQRPMSQHLWALQEIERKAGLEKRLLRPLSALQLPPTEAEEKGWVDRSKLFAITGRSRKEQMRLAAAWGIVDFPNPGGGCLLTEKHFCARLHDLIDHGSASLRNCRLLQHGRYFRLSESFFLIVGHNQADNESIRGLAETGDCLIEPESLPGPTALGIGRFDDETLDTALSIVARYTAPDAETVTVRQLQNGSQTVHTVRPLDEVRVRACLI